ncbi:MAG: DUF4276 family protein [bacterium]|nr:DUF4276 family protein [bacterium]
MSQLRIAPIVEGHGEQAAVRVLLTRIWNELLGGEHLDVLRPIRLPRSKLVQEKELGKAIDLAMLKLRAAVPEGMPGMILVLLDADEDKPCLLGPKLLGYALETRQDADVACVIANVEYETWFVAAAESLNQYLDIGDIPDAPEDLRCRKGWIQKRFRGPKYSETVDQPALTAALDLALCRRRSPSFDKLCRELAGRLE